MGRLPEPRRYGGAALANARHASSCGGLDEASADDIANLLEAGDGDAICSLRRQAPSAGAYRALWERVCRAVDMPRREAADAVATRVFALPLIFITAAPAPQAVRDALPDIAAVEAVLARHGALGPTRNFGLSNALVPLDAIERLSPVTVYRWQHAAPGAGARELEARGIEVSRSPEQVSLRFLVGAGIASAEAPALDGTAATIGAWGMPLARELGRQLAAPGLDLLAIPRPPTSILRAAHAGRRAQLESAFHLFASNTVRKFRAASGEPAVVLSVHQLDGGGAEVRVSLSSRLDDTALEGFRWPLDPLDDLAEIEDVIVRYFAECRVDAALAIETVLPDRAVGEHAFIPIARVDRLQGGAAPAH